ncbi:MAG: FAD-binding oxidoreductase [Pseudomonadota bacterium]
MIEQLRAQLGPAALVTGAEMHGYLQEWRGTYTSDALAVVLPGSVADVQTIVRLASEHDVSLVPQGGNTGLVGGAVANPTQLIVNLTRLNRIRSLDRDNASMLVEAGCTLDIARQAAAAEGLLLALDLSSAGSCQIGGNVSTNAGGVNVLRYGSIRQQVLGLEVVTASGDVFDATQALRKNNSGYDLKQLFIGAEGTLGIVTAVHLCLFAQPQQRTVMWVSVPDVQAVVHCFGLLRERFSGNVSAFELIPDIAVQFVTQHMSGMRRVSDARGVHALIELHDVSPDARPLQGVVAHMAAQYPAFDAVIATSEAQAQMMWGLRHHISDAQRCEGASVKHDIALPISQIAPFIESVLPEIERLVTGIRPVIFGHIGDGNLHFNLSQPVGVAADAFRAHTVALNDLVNNAVIAYGGTVSAEHGIGLQKRAWLERQVGGSGVAMMRAIKQALDPEHRFNPGKIL